MREANDMEGEAEKNGNVVGSLVDSAMEGNKNEENNEKES